MAKAGRANEKPSFDLMVTLCHYDWPYNVRELEAAIRRAVAVAARAPLDTRFLPGELRDAMAEYGRADGEPPSATSSPTGGERAASGLHADSPPSTKTPARRGAPPEAELRDITARAQGNVSEVARVLGKDRAQTHRWLRQAGIDPEAYRKK
jgi:DNA-binding NtrC family response regulator